MTTTAEVEEAGNLLTIAQVRDILDQTEPVSSYEFSLDGTDSVQFSLPKDWNAEEDFRKEPPDTVTQCSVAIGGSEFQLTKEAILAMTSAIGLTKDYVLRSPGPMISPQLNWWVKHNGVKGADSMRLLTHDGVGRAFVKSSLVPISSLALLEEVVTRISETFETSEEDLRVDRKIAHSYQRTALRIVIPSESYHIESARHSDATPDRWSLGIQLINSLMADPESRLQLSGYLFAWLCSNGAIACHASVPVYNRRLGQEMGDILSWTSAACHTIFSELPNEVDGVRDLTSVELAGELNVVLADVFKEFPIPKMAQQPIVDNMVENSDLTGYGVMQAITSVANQEGLSDHVRTTLMSVGGLLPDSLTDRCQTCHRVRVS